MLAVRQHHAKWNWSNSVNVAGELRREAKEPLKFFTWWSGQDEDSFLPAESWKTTKENSSLLEVFFLTVLTLHLQVFMTHLRKGQTFRFPPERKDQTEAKRLRRGKTRRPLEFMVWDLIEGVELMYVIFPPKKGRLNLWIPWIDSDRFYESTTWKFQGYPDILSFWMVLIDFQLCLQMKEAGPRSTGQPNLTTYSSHGPRKPGWRDRP